MSYQGFGRIVKSIGGLFEVRLFDRAHCPPQAEHLPAPLDGCTVTARGRGSLHRKDTLLVGDIVEVSYDDSSYQIDADGTPRPRSDGANTVIDRFLPRTSALIRPPMANLDVLFVTFAATSPEPDLQTVDKLVAIAEHNRIEPVPVITKSDLAPAFAEQLCDIYRRAGFRVFRSGRDAESELPALRQFASTALRGKIAAFSGASGVGKTTLLNALFPQLHLETGEISRRIQRGKNTTRCVELYPLDDTANCGFLADTPGFSMLDFKRFDFFELEDLPFAFREFGPYIGACRYTKCSHTKEQGCAVLAAVREGKISLSRHQSFVSIYDVLKNKSKY